MIILFITLRNLNSLYFSWSYACFLLPYRCISLIFQPISIHSPWSGRENTTGKAKKGVHLSTFFLTFSIRDIISSRKSENPWITEQSMSQKQNQEKNNQRHRKRKKNLKITHFILFFIRVIEPCIIHFPFSWIRQHYKVQNSTNENNNPKFLNYPYSKRRKNCQEAEKASSISLYIQYYTLPE